MASHWCRREAGRAHTPAWGACADCTPPPRALPPSGAAHPQSTRSCPLARCSVWPRSWRPPSIAGRAKSWRVSSWGEREGVLPGTQGFTEDTAVGCHSRPCLTWLGEGKEVVQDNQHCYSSSRARRTKDQCLWPPLPLSVPLNTQAGEWPFPFLPEPYNWASVGSNRHRMEKNEGYKEA